LQFPRPLGCHPRELEIIPTPRRTAVEKKSRKLATAVRVAGWSLAGAALYALFLAAVGGGLPMSEFLAVGRDALLPGVVPGGAVPGLSALDLFQLALALLVGMAFRRFLV